MTANMDNNKDYHLSCQKSSIKNSRNQYVKSVFLGGNKLRLVLSRSYGTLFYHNLQDVSSLVLYVSKDGTDMARHGQGLGPESGL